MTYSDEARALRQCQARTKDGQPCQNFAVWDDPARRCGTHGGRVAGAHIREKTAYTPCDCEAYPFPHRPGSGLCCWPDPPAYRLNIRPGTHAQGRRDPLVRGLTGAQPSAIAAWRHFGEGQMGYPQDRRWCQEHEA